MPVGNQTAGSPPPRYVTAQGINSSTWSSPSLDGSMYIPEMIDHHLHHSAQHPFCLLVGEEADDQVTVTWEEVGHAVHRLGARFQEAVNGGPATSEGLPKTVAILASLDSLTYGTVLLALLRAGFHPFPLSPRNSLPALEHLIRATNTSYVLGSSSDSETSSAVESTTAALLEALPGLCLIQAPNFEDLYPRLASNPVRSYVSANDGPTTLLPPVRSLASYKNAGQRWPCLILHSSASTKFPKPIPIHHEATLSTYNGFWHGDVDMCGSLFGAMAWPSFHAVGVWVTLGAALCTGSVSAIFKPSNPPKMPTPENCLQALRLSGAKHTIVPPTFCESWSTDDESIKFLSSLKTVLFGGGPLTQSAGDRLVEGGVPLQVEYGATEAGLFTKFIAHKGLGGHDWNYAELARHIKFELVHEKDKAYRLVVVESEGHELAVHNVPGQRKYDTGDLAEEHVEHKGYWKLLGRLDDQIVMLNGEKTNPGPLEDIILSNRSIRSAVMFGQGRRQVGVIIEPMEQVCVTSDAELEAFRNEIWPDVEKANRFAPTHSRLFKEYLLVVDPTTKPLARTPKGTIMRGAVLKEFEREINAIYEAAEPHIEAAWAEPPSDWSIDSIRVFVHRVVKGVLGERVGSRTPVDEDRDLFEQGCDSLQATYIRAAIVRAFKTNPPQSYSSVMELQAEIHQNLVYTYPTLRRLVRFLANLTDGVSSYAHDNRSLKDEQLSSMLRMVDKYTKDFPFRSITCSAERDSKSKIVLLTGSTGSLGTYLLELLLNDPGVARVYAVNRTSRSADIRERQREAFSARGVDASLLFSSKLRLVEADLSKPDLGLDSALLTEIRSSVTIIIHNAWLMDFNLGLPSYEILVRGTRNLVDLALSSKETLFKFVFTSSIGTVQSWDMMAPVPEERLSDPALAGSNGYCASKWVAQEVLTAAAEERGLDVTIWRIGQLAGSKKNGAWSPTDWLPIIVKASQVMGFMPWMDGLVTWVPVDKAAASILEALHSARGKAPQYLHLVNPHPVTWNTVFEAFSQVLCLPLSPFREWLAALQATAASDPLAVDHNPAIKLLQYIAEMQTVGYGDSTDEPFGVRLATTHTINVCPVLAGLTELQEEDIQNWTRFWRKQGLLD